MARCDVVKSDIASQMMALMPGWSRAMMISATQEAIHTGTDIADNDIRLNDQDLCSSAILLRRLPVAIQPRSPQWIADARPLRMADSLSTIITFQHGSHLFFRRAVIVGASGTVLVPCPGSDLIDMRGLAHYSGETALDVVHWRNMCVVLVVASGLGDGRRKSSCRHRMDVRRPPPPRC